MSQNERTGYSPTWGPVTHDISSDSSGIPQPPTSRARTDTACPVSHGDTDIQNTSISSLSTPETLRGKRTAPATTTPASQGLTLPKREGKGGPPDSPTRKPVRESSRKHDTSTQRSPPRREKSFLSRIPPHHVRFGRLDQGAPGAGHDRAANGPQPKVGAYPLRPVHCLCRLRSTHQSTPHPATTFLRRGIWPPPPDPPLHQNGP